MGRSSLLVEKAQGSTLFGTKGSTKKGFFRIMSKIGDLPRGTFRTPNATCRRKNWLFKAKTGFWKFRTPGPPFGTKLI